jgi:hypothetical protein
MQSVDMGSRTCLESLDKVAEVSGRDPDCRCQNANVNWYVLELLTVLPSKHTTAKSRHSQRDVICGENRMLMPKCRFKPIGHILGMTSFRLRTACFSTSLHRAVRGPMRGMRFRRAMSTFRLLNGWNVLVELLYVVACQPAVVVSFLGCILMQAAA